MNNQTATTQLKDFINDFYLPDDAQIKKLRSIIRKETGRKITYEDAEEIGLQLLSLYQCLARNQKIIPIGSKNEPRE